MSDLNPNCEGTHCTADSSETRRFRMDPDDPDKGAMILCRVCMGHENKSRRFVEPGAEPARLFDWEQAEVYPEPDEEECGNQHGYFCPNCRSSNDLAVYATVARKLVADGTDFSGNADEEWTDDSVAFCGCGWSGEVRELTIPRAKIPYGFEVKLAGVIRINANDRKEAEKILHSIDACSDARATGQRDGWELTEFSVDDASPHCFEIGGVCGSYEEE